MDRVVKAGLIFSAIVGLQVWTFAGGISLEKVMLDVCTKSDSTKSLQEVVKKSKQQIREQYANALPTVTGQIFAGHGYGIGMAKSSGGGGSGNNPTDSGIVTFDTLYSILGNTFGNTMRKMYEPGDAEVYSTSINISQPIYTFGKIGTAVNVAKYFDSSNLLTYDRSLQLLQLQGFDAFYSVVLAEMALSVLERSVARKKELSEFLTRNFSLGSGSKAQMLLTKADLESLWPEIITSRQQARAARRLLNVLMGNDSNDSLQLDTSSVSMMPSLLTMRIPSMDEALKNAVSDRTDIRSIDYLKKANDGGVKIYKANYLPSIAAQFSAGTSSKSLEDLFNFKDYGNWQAGVGLQWQLFDGFASSAKAQQYQSDSRKLEITKKSILKYLEIEIENALSECIVADSNLIAANVIYEALQEAYQLTDDNFKQGDGQFTELQLAEERLRQGEMNIFNAQYRQKRSRAALLVTMGRTIIPMEGK